ncbi:MAG: ABC transporter ATP-binding protein [Gammaproteobacteria bacterium]|nr:ABC transporter ATP-binding protein [Gammaproteobacteria bacterium]
MSLHELTPPSIRECPVFEFDGVSKTYDGRRLAVDNLHLDVNAGEFLTILGPSGSGKTTILMMLAGFERPTTGQIRHKGDLLDDIPPYRRNIGVVFQELRAVPSQERCREHRLPPAPKARPQTEITRRPDTILRLVELEGLEHRRPSQLSGGQQQRVALARALVFDPSLVLMDEPLGSLDRQLREQMQHELKRIHRSTGATFVYVTHDQDEALAMSDRIAVIHDGVLQQVGNPREVYDRPANRFVASFIGENNIVSGRISEVVGPRHRMTTGNGLEIGIEYPGELAIGRQVDVCVRPEHLLLNPPGDGRFNAIQASVKEVVFYGDHTRLQLDVPGHGVFLAKLNIAFGIDELLPGTEVHVGWNAGSGVVLTDRAGGGTEAEVPQKARGEVAVRHLREAPTAAEPWSLRK